MGGILNRNINNLSDTGSDWRDFAIHWVSILIGGYKGGPNCRVVATDAELGNHQEIQPRCSALKTFPVWTGAADHFNIIYGS